MPDQHNPVLVEIGMENVTLKVFFSFEEAVTSVLYCTCTVQVNCNFWLPTDSMCVPRNIYSSDHNSKNKYGCNLNVSMPLSKYFSF